MTEYKRYTITSALPYANGPVHIGHLAGVYVPADIYARYLRARGRDVMFIGGSDEHGVPVTIRAQKEGITVQQVVDRYHNLIKKSFEEFGISFDIYSRTTSAIHHKFASDFFRKLYDQGQLEEKTEEQFCDEVTGEFLTDRNIVGECPRCHAQGAYGDQCEKCGATLSPDELINPTNKNHPGHGLVKRPTKNWYLPLGNYQEWLKKWIIEGHQEWKSNVYGQCKSWLDMDLQSRAMTRDLEWGIPVPIEGAKGKVLYVWFDAPIGYISNTKELCESNPERWGTWQQWWQSDDARLIHFIGKDNIVFHCIIFPTMMKAHGGYIMPDNVPANEFLNLEGDKISTSKNWAVWLNEYLVDFPGKQDVLRYVLTANAPETKDNDFTWKDFQARNNNELVAILGNFVNRTIVLTQKYYGGKAPVAAEITDYDREALNELAASKERIEQAIEQFKFREALKLVMDIARLGNKYLAETEPWKVVKTDPDRVRTIMNVCLQIVANLSIACDPFMPFSAEKMRQLLNIPQLNWEHLGAPNLIEDGHQIAEPFLLFEKIEDDAIDAQIKRLQDIKKANEDAEKANAPAAPMKPLITYDDFSKMDIRTATILEAERVPKSDKLMKLLVDTGIDKRTVVSGVAKHFTAEELIGKRVTILANLAPRKLMGIESHGMILMAENFDGALSMIPCEKDFKNGSVIC